MPDTDFSLRPLQNSDMPSLARLYREGIPRAVFCALGNRFLASFFGRLLELENVTAWGAEDQQGRLRGVIVGTTDRGQSYSTVLHSHRAALLGAAGLRLLSPSVVGWLVRKLFDRFRPGRRQSVTMPDAELLLISVDPEARGTGLAQQLVHRMELSFCDMGFVGDYSIFTEATNERSNRFYQRIGCQLFAKLPRRGILIHCYRKSNTCSGGV